MNELTHADILRAERDKADPVPVAWIESSSGSTISADKLACAVQYIKDAWNAVPKEPLYRKTK